MIDGATEDWRVHYWSDYAKAVLSAALRSGDKGANQDGRALINRLAARGLFDFGHLVNEI